ESLGGQLLLAAQVPGLSEIEAIVPWYGRELQRLGVGVHLGKSLDPHDIVARRSEAVIIATGSRGATLQDSDLTEAMPAMPWCMARDALVMEPVHGRRTLFYSTDQTLEPL